jgi:hypothetical protein
MPRTLPRPAYRKSLAKTTWQKLSAGRPTPSAACIMKILGGMNFKAHPLPAQLQFSTLNAYSLVDLDSDGRMEVVLGGNFYECNIEMGRYDANFGNVLRFDKNGGMQVFPLGDLRIKGQVRRIESVKIGKRPAFVFARNNDRCLVLSAGF